MPPPSAIDPRQQLLRGAHGAVGGHAQLPLTSCCIVDVVKGAVGLRVSRLSATTRAVARSANGIQHFFALRY